MVKLILRISVVLVAFVFAASNSPGKNFGKVTCVVGFPALLFENGFNLDHYFCRISVQFLSRTPVRIFQMAKRILLTGNRA